MRVLFFMRNFSGYFRQFEPAVRELLKRGHAVHIARDRTKDDMRGEEWVQDIQAEFPQLTWGKTPPALSDRWYELRRNIRLSRDYVQFLRPEYAETGELVRRARDRAPAATVRVGEGWLAERPRLARAAHGWLRAMEDALPPTPAAMSMIAEQEPDIVLLTPHLMPGSPQQDYLRAARALGLPTALCVASWDNLSSKQLIRFVPDVVTVWNATQREEAERIHGVPRERIAVTGAQAYDHWFDWKPRPREEFCARVGLEPHRAYVLYAAGALFPAEITEAEFVVRWLRALRESPQAELRDIAVLIRPHPKRFAEWQDVDLEGLGPLASWPQEGRMPVDRAARADFYDSIFHSAGVVGVNTSAMIEAGIVGKRVHAILVPEFHGSQNGTLHFQYLTEVGGGLLSVADDLDRHLHDLAGTVARDGDDGGANTGFLEAFVRPHGLGVPAAPIFVDVIERTAEAGARASGASTPRNA